MADTAVTVTKLTPGSSTADVAGTAIVAANTHTITIPTGAAPEEIVLRLRNTTAATKVLTVTAGDAPHAAAASKLDVSLTDGSSTPQVAWVPLASSKFLKKGSTVVVTVAASTTGDISAFWIPRTA